MAVFWSWEEGRIGDRCHAFKVGRIGETSLCDSALPTAPMMRPPWYEMRCPACEEMRRGESEVFPNVLLDAVKTKLTNDTQRSPHGRQHPD